MKTNYEKLYLIQPQIYHKVLPLLNEIDKRNVTEINEDYNTDSQHGEAEIIPEFEGSINAQNNSDHLPVTQEVLPDTALPEENLSTENSAIDSLSSTEMPKEKSYFLKSSSTSEIPNSHVMKMRPKRYICEICINRGFTTKFSLRRHNNQFHKKDGNIKTVSIKPDVLSNSEPEVETINKNSKRPRDELLEKTEVQNIQESKKLERRGMKRGINTEEMLNEQHLPRKSARIQSYKRKSQWPEKPPKRISIQKGQGLLNWVNF